MSPLRIFLLGGLRLDYDRERLLPLPSRKASSLFAYLVLYRHHAHTRDLLAGTFWPDLPDAQARRRLSQALWQIGCILRPLLTPYLLLNTTRVQFNPAAPYWLDVEEFQRFCDRFDTREPGLAPLETGEWERAITLYRGDFLAGFYEDWILSERERLRETYLGVLARLLTRCKAAGVDEEALRYALRLVAEDPLQEESHCEVMRLCYRLGRLQQALQQYAQCRSILAEELGIEPAATTTALYNEIAARVAQTEIPYLPPSTGSLPSPLFEGPGQVALVGREQERAILVNHLELAVKGQGGVVLVEGEAGVGKTRLLQEIARDAGWRGMQVLWGHGRELTELPPYALLVEALRAGLSPLRAGQLAQLLDVTWLREVSLLLPELTEWLPDLPSRALSVPGQAGKRLLAGLTHILLALGQIVPHLLILEDLQWADAATLDALAYLAHHLRPPDGGGNGGRLLIMGSYRGEEARSLPAVWEALQAVDRAGCRERLGLARLTVEETGELLCRGLGLREKAPRFEAWLYRETEGNPLFVLETLRALHDEKLLYRDTSGGWCTPWDETTTDYTELTLPPGVYQVIARRLARLATMERATLNAAAVLGADFDFALLTRCVNLPPETTLAAVGELVRRRLLEEGLTAYRFSHDKIRQVAYQETPAVERRRLHLQAGEALETLHPELVEALAFHFTMASVRDRALNYTLRAGERAHAVYDYRTALACYQRAMTLVGNDPAARWHILDCQEKALDVLGRREAQAEVLAEMLSLTDVLQDPVRRARTRLRQGWREVLGGEPTSAIAFLGEAAELARTAGDLNLLGQCLIAVARAWWRVGDTHHCRAAVEEAQAIYRQTGNRQGEIHVCNMLGNLHLGLTGNYAQALVCFEQNCRLCHELGDFYGEASARGNMGITYNLLGCYQQAQAALAATDQVMTRVGDRHWQGIIRHWQAANCCDLGNWEQGWRIAQEAVNICREVSDRNFEIAALELLGRIALEQEDPGLAYSYFQQSSEVAHASQQLADWSIQQSHLGLTCLRLGRREEACRLSDQAMATLEQLGEEHSHLKEVYFERYQIIAAITGPEAAWSYLEKAYQALSAMADKIDDPDLRRSFLENVRVHRAIVAAYREVKTGVRTGRYRLSRAGVPAGRPLRDEERVTVILTVTTPEDEVIANKTARRQHRLQRLLYEASQQGAVPTVGDLATALDVSQATIKRDLAVLRQMGQEVRTRGKRSSSIKMSRRFG